MSLFISIFSKIVSWSIRSSLCLLIVLVNIAHAQDKGYSPAKMAMLPSYCKHTQLFRENVPGGNNQTEIARWNQILGDTFRHLHHYCWGLMQTNDAVLDTRSRQERNGLLITSINEFNYVLRNAPKDFPLLPEILTRKGENLLRLDRVVEGTSSLEQAMELKPDYWPPYSVLSDYHKEKQNLALARSYLEKGIAAAPDAKPLQQRLRELASPKNP